ncbi:MAG: uracil-DNA glycosylase family protein [Hyphomicrobiaceae bacterium]|nr:MAG: uracil-DNA glycosylase family protein [Hyphomicrobiaceae bacterium]
MGWSSTSETTARAQDALSRLVTTIEACRICVDAAGRKPLPHEPRPVLRVSATARILVCGQAPGVRVHASGKPFTDPSGVRLRQWMGVSEKEFYDVARVAILPMGFCFPGHDAHGGDLPPRLECARAWRAKVMARLSHVELILLVGSHAHAWHLGGGRSSEANVSSTVAAWRTHLAAAKKPLLMPLPHPSWRNNAWLKRNTWFESDLVPELRRRVRELL